MIKKFEEREQIVLENQGQKIFGIMHRPLKNAPYPSVLICHGLGGHKTGKFRLYVHLAEKLSQLGIGALRIDFRGSGDSEGEFSDMTIESEVSDALVAFDYLMKDSKVDQSRLGLFGRSFGGLVAVKAAYRVGNVKSLALWAPMYSGDQWLEKWQTVQSTALSLEEKNEIMRVNGLVPGRNFFEELFRTRLDVELNALQKLPMLHIHGEKDVIVNLSHADHFNRHRKAAEGLTKFLRLPHSDHDFSHPAEQAIALEETMNWFRNTLL